MADRWQVELFLREFFGRWPPASKVIPREKNNNALLELGLIPKIRQEEIFSLTYKDYVGGPKEDKDEPGEVWEFGKMVEGTEIYIKLKLFITESGKNSAKCLSFHKAERPLTYPFK